MLGNVPGRRTPGHNDARASSCPTHTEASTRNASWGILLRPVESGWEEKAASSQPWCRTWSCLRPGTALALHYHHDDSTDRMRGLAVAGRGCHLRRSAAAKTVASVSGWPWALSNWMADSTACLAPVAVWPRRKSAAGITRFMVATVDSGTATNEPARRGWQAGSAASSNLSAPA